MTVEKNTALDLGQFGRLCGFSPDEARSAAIAEFSEKLRGLPEFSRKLLAQIVELACREHHDGRKPGIAYLPEVYETCGIGVDELYKELQQIEKAGFIRLEGEYPFQDVVLTEVALSGQHPWPLLRDLGTFCAAEGVSLREVIVSLRFDRLS